MAESNKNAGKPAKTAAKESESGSSSQGVRSEFKKIVWPTKDRLWQETVAVMIISVALGAFIRLWDLLCQYAINFIK